MQTLRACDIKLKGKHCFPIFISVVNYNLLFLFFFYFFLLLILFFLFYVNGDLNLIIYFNFIYKFDVLTWVTQFTSLVGLPNIFYFNF